MEAAVCVAGDRAAIEGSCGHKVTLNSQKNFLALWYHSCPKKQSAEVACGMQCGKTVYAYSYVRKTGDASVITLGAQHSCSRKVNI